MNQKGPAHHLLGCRIHPPQPLLPTDVPTPTPCLPAIPQEASHTAPESLGTKTKEPAAKPELRGNKRGMLKILKSNLLKEDVAGGGRWGEGARPSESGGEGVKD